MVQLTYGHRKEIFDKMREKNIGVHVHYIPVYWHPYYASLGYEKGLCPIAETWYARALTLPIHPTMTDEQQQYVITQLFQTIQQAAR